MKPFTTATYGDSHLRAQVDYEGKISIWRYDPTTSRVAAVVWLEPKDAKRFRKWLKEAGF